MKNFVQQGNTITITALTDVVSGGGVMIKDTFGVAAFDVAQNEDVEIVLEGVFTLTKAVVEIPQGARVYWDDANKNVTISSTGNLLIGIATVSVLDVDPEVNVRLNGSF